MSTVPKWRKQEPIVGHLLSPNEVRLERLKLGLQALLEVNLRLATTAYLSTGYDGL